MLIEVTQQEWERLVKSALQNWHRPVELSQHPFADLDIVKERFRLARYEEDYYGRTKAIRDVLRAGIHALAAEGADPPTDKNDPTWAAVTWRHYSILTLLYAKGLSRGEVQLRIGLAEGGQYFRDQARAIDLLATVLREWEGLPTDAAPIALLTYPSGAVPLADKFYVKRKADVDLKNELRKSGITATIRGPRQVGKTSLLIRGIQWAKQKHQAEVVYIDLQGIGSDPLKSLERFSRELVDCLVEDVGLDPETVDRIWQSKLGTHRKMTKLLGQYLLPQVKRPILLAMDEIDRLLLTDFHTEFFGLLRSWHNRRAQDSLWNKLNILMAISTEPYLLIDDLNQSPFNVGLTIYLTDFSVEQVAELNRRYGTPIKESDLPQLMRLLNGHPYLTRVAFYRMARDQQTWHDFFAAAATDNGPFREHLHYQHRLLLGDPTLKRALEQILVQGRCSDESSRFRLLKAGLIKGNGNDFSCRCDLYRLYFEGKL